MNTPGRSGALNSTRATSSQPRFSRTTTGWALRLRRSSRSRRGFSAPPRLKTWSRGSTTTSMARAARAGGRRRQQPEIDAVLLGQGGEALRLDDLELVEPAGQRPQQHGLGAAQQQGAPREQAGALAVALAVTHHGVVSPGRAVPRDSSGTFSGSRARTRASSGPISG